MTSIDAELAAHAHEHLAQHIADDHGLTVEGDETRAELEEAHEHLHAGDAA